MVRNARKNKSKLYCSLHGENTSHTTMECKFLKAKGKEKPKYSAKYYKRKSRELNILEKEASHQRAKYLKYRKLNKAFSKKKTRVILDDPSESNSSSSSEADNSPDEGEKISIAYDLASGNSDESSNIATDTEEEVWNNGCRDEFIIDN